MKVSAKQNGWLFLVDDEGGEMYMRAAEVYRVEKRAHKDEVRLWAFDRYWVVDGTLTEVLTEVIAAGGSK